MSERLRLDMFKTAEWRRVIDRRKGDDSEDGAERDGTDDEHPIIEVSLGETEDAPAGETEDADQPEAAR
jgi:hypothetical protein